MAKKKVKKFTGDFKEKSIVAHKFIEAYNKLKQKGLVDSYKDITEKYGYEIDVMSNIAAGKQDVPMILLWALVMEYGVDANFLFDQQKETFR
jgi:hypothetical protein